MRTWTLAFMLGIVAVQFFPGLPGINLAFLPLPVIFLILVFKRYKYALTVILCLCCGFSWALLTAHLGVAQRLPADLEGEDIVIRGIVANMPRHDVRASRFDFKVKQLLQNGTWQDPGWLLSLKWYGKNRPVIKAGQYWQFTVKLKRPHGMANPGTFDYEKWLFARGISASGYVRHNRDPELLAEIYGYAFWHRWREAIAAHIDNKLANHEMLAIVRALALGDRSAMNRQHWQVLTNTGTSHLVAISGLHVGLVAGFVFWITAWLASRSSWLCSRQPARVYAAIAALVSAAIYAMLAGFAIPTQRALVMFVVVMMGIIFRRNASSLDMLVVAMLAVVVFDPLSVLSAGFWLSFTAVLVILVSLKHRITAEPFYHQWRIVQWSISIGLLPLLVILFGRISLVAPLVNLFAVPWVSFISLPLLMLALPASLTGNTFLLELAADSLQVMWVALNWVASLPFASLYLSSSSWWNWLLAISGIAILLLPRGMPMRLFGVVCLLPVLLVRADTPLQGQFTVRVLDVGQGLSVIVQTASKTLVYDTGAKLSDRFDIGQAVVVPVLHNHGIDRINTLVISHGDNDHRGGMESVIEAIPVNQVLSGDPARLDISAQPCHAGQQWQWDGVYFEIIYPGRASELASKSNNRSCVLRVSNNDYSVLLTGDIESDAEKRLLASRATELGADILLVPHHGSSTSSSTDFIEAVQPRYAVFSNGYRNRYGFPREEVLKRYRTFGSIIYRTDESGMLSFMVSENAPISVESWRERSQRYWHAQ